MHSPIKKYAKMSASSLAFVFLSACVSLEVQDPDSVVAAERSPETIEAEPSSSAGNAPALKATLDAMFDPFDVEGAPGGAVVVMQDGKVLYERYYGLASLEMQAPITNGTVFNSGSVSKQFTAYAAMKLAKGVRLYQDAA